MNPRCNKKYNFTGLEPISQNLIQSILTGLIPITSFSRISLDSGKQLALLSGGRLEAAELPV